MDIGMNLSTITYSATKYSEVNIWFYFIFGLKSNSIKYYKCHMIVLVDLFLYPSILYNARQMRMGTVYFNSGCVYARTVHLLCLLP